MEEIYKLYVENVKSSQSKKSNKLKSFLAWRLNDLFEENKCKRCKKRLKNGISKYCLNCFYDLKYEREKCYRLRKNS